MFWEKMLVLKEFKNCLAVLSHKSKGGASSTQKVKGLVEKSIDFSGGRLLYGGKIGDELGSTKSSILEIVESFCPYECSKANNRNYPTIFHVFFIF
jgi:hypothetical protein